MLQLDQAIASGDIKASIDKETALDMLYGPLFFRLLAGHEPLNAQLANDLIDLLFNGMSAN